MTTAERRLGRRPRPPEAKFLHLAPYQHAPLPPAPAEWHGPTDATFATACTAASTDG